MADKKQKTIKAPDPLKSEEKALENSMLSMVELMSRMYKNQVLLEMNKGTIEKFTDSIKFNDSSQTVLVNRSVRFFDYYEKRTTYSYERDEYGDDHATDPREIDFPIYSYKDELLRVNPRLIKDGDRLQFADAQTGNYAVVLTKLSNRIRKKLLSRFSNKRIKELSERVLGNNDRRAKKLFFEEASKNLGIDVGTLLKRDVANYDFNALVLETTQWAKKLRDETLETYTANTLRAMTQGESLDSILSQYDDLVEKRKNHAKFTARNQVASFNSIMNKTRAQKLGIKKAIWVTSKDERVRPSHQVRDGKEFDLSEGLYSSRDGQYLLPGVDYQCRCSYKMVIDED